MNEAPETRYDEMDSLLNGIDDLAKIDGKVTAYQSLLATYRRLLL